MEGFLVMEDKNAMRPEDVSKLLFEEIGRNYTSPEVTGIPGELKPSNIIEVMAAMKGAISGMTECVIKLGNLVSDCQNLIESDQGTTGWINEE